MKTNNISLGLGVFGATVVVISIIRWFFMYYDLSSLLFGGGIGVVFLIFAYIYHFMRKTDERLKEAEKRLDAFAMWWTNQEKDQVKNEALGND